MNHLGRILVRPTPFLCLLLMAASGCALPYKVGVTPTGTPQYGRVAIDYERADAHGILTSVDGATSGESDADELSHLVSGQGDQTLARLHIRYPHPNGDSSHALLTLHVSTPTEPTTDGLPRVLGRLTSPITFVAWRGDGETDERAQQQSNDGASLGDQEDDVRTLELSKTELDLLLVDLAYTGFFDDQDRPEGGSQLSVRIDRGHHAHRWIAEQRLDELVNRVATDGRRSANTTVR